MQFCRREEKQRRNPIHPLLPSLSPGLSSTAAYKHFKLRRRSVFLCCSCISHAYAFRFHKHKLGSANIYRFHRGLVTNQNQDRFYRYKKLSIKIVLKFCHRPFCIAFKKFIKHVCYVVWRNCGIRLKLLTSQFWKIGEVLGLRECDRYFESP